MTADCPVRPGVELGTREVQVLRCAADGMSTAEIGVELRIGVNTVKTHLASALDKLGARNRAHAVYLALKAEVIA